MRKRKRETEDESLQQVEVLPGQWNDDQTFARVLCGCDLELPTYEVTQVAGKVAI